MVAVKPEIRDILWAYKRDNDLGKAIDKLEEVLGDVWNYAILSHKRDYSTELDKVIEKEMKNKPKDIMK